VHERLITEHKAGALKGARQELAAQLLEAEVARLMEGLKSKKK